MSNKDKIVNLIKKNEQMSVDQLANELEISLSMVHRHIKKMLGIDFAHAKRIGGIGIDRVMMFAGIVN